MGTAKILTRSIRMDGGGEAPVLCVQVEIECEMCGTYTIIVMGHHVQALIESLQEVAGQEPELTSPGEMEVLYRKVNRYDPGLN